MEMKGLLLAWLSEGMMVRGMGELSIWRAAVAAVFAPNHTSILQVRKADAQEVEPVDGTCLRLPG